MASAVYNQRCDCNSSIECSRKRPTKQIMVEVKIGSIWTPHSIGAYAIIPTNTHGIMGAGVAQAAADRYPTLRRMYKTWVQTQNKADPMIWPVGRLILFPTKYRPALSADTDLIKEAASLLLEKLRRREFKYRITSPLLGCGLGGLKWETVEPLLRPLADWGVEFYKER